MNEIRETCGCGAIWVGPTAYSTERAAFREAHNTCRSPQADTEPMSDSPPPSCCCEDPLAPGIVHRSEGPCYEKEYELSEHLAAFREALADLRHMVKGEQRCRCGGHSGDSHGCPIHAYELSEKVRCCNKCGYVGDLIHHEEVTGCRYLAYTYYRGNELQALVKMEDERDSSGSGETNAS